MRNALRLALALSGASIFAAAFVIACSDDTSVTPSTEAGTDGGPDSPKGDTGPGPDAGPDTSPPFDGGFVLENFDNVLATAICKSLSRCCYGTATPGDGGADGGTFDMAACVSKFEQVGFQGSNLGTAIKDAGNVSLDQVSADDCIKKVSALTCDLPGPEYAAARKACFGAYSGKFGASQPCKAAVECQRGFFCKGQVDGGTGVCTALRGLNGACGDNPDHPTEYEESCSYRGGGDTNLYCKFYDFAGGGTDLDAGDWKCTAAGSAATKCATSNWCKDTICDPSTNVCKSPDKLFDDACGLFVK